MRLIDIIQDIDAGGPGSGRKPGFGQGKTPGNKPFGMKSGLHKVLTDAGYQHRGAVHSFGKGGGRVDRHIYTHPDSGKHVAVHSDGSWASYKKGEDPLQVGSYPDRYGEGASVLQQELAH
jgi:hypothetical protein